MIVFRDKPAYFGAYMKGSSDFFYIPPVPPSKGGSAESPFRRGDGGDVRNYKYLILFIFLMTFPLYLPAQGLPDRAAPARLCATPFTGGEGPVNAWKILHRNRPAFYRELLAEDALLQRQNSARSDVRTFWAVKVGDLSQPIEPEDFYRVEATRRAEGEGVVIWVEDESWAQEYVTQVEVDRIFDALTRETGAGSLDPGEGIIAIERSVFGETPNKGDDGLIHFLILDIQDTYDPDNNVSTFIAGYFFANDQGDGPRSNRLDLLYIDAYPGIYRKEGDRRTGTVLATTAHELQHLIHYRQDRDEATWVNEGLSELAASLCGYGIGRPQRYLEDTAPALDGWANTLADYSRAGLWTLYLEEQFGTEFIRALTADPANGIAGIEAALAVSGFGETFSSVFADWNIANYLNNSSISGGRFGYRSPDLHGLRARVREETDRFPARLNVDLEENSAAYYRLSGRDSLVLDFQGFYHRGTLIRQRADTAEVLDASGDMFQLHAIAEDDRLTLVLNNTSGASQYDLCAYAPFALPLRRVAYDDGEFTSGITGRAQAAQRFAVPAEGAVLTRIEFFSLQRRRRVRVQVFGEENGLPGPALDVPLDTLFAARRSWVELDLRQPLTGLSAGQALYVAVEADTLAYAGGPSGSGIAYYRPEGENWRPLENETNSAGEPLRGVWMIRAVFAGPATAASAPGCDPDTPLRFVPEALYPNPSRGELTLELPVTAAGEVRLTLYNLLGQPVSEFRREVPGAARLIRITWPNIRSSNGQTLPSGIYFLRAKFIDRASGTTQMADPQKLVLIR